MYYNEFLDEIEKQVKNRLPKEMEVICHQIMKNNGILLDAISIRKREEPVSPTIYLNVFYEEYKEGKTIDEIVDEIMELYVNHHPEFEWDLDQFLDFEQVRKKIVFKVINKQKNYQLLKEIPHKDILDLSIVYYCLVESSEYENASILIQNRHCEIWDITGEELYQIAIKNSALLLPYCLDSMEKIMKEIFYNNVETCWKSGDKENVNTILNDWIAETEKEENRIPMYILTNQVKMYGAACMFYPQVLERFAEKLKQDLYILPSSIHEVILLPANEIGNPEELKEMVREVNQHEVAGDEILSDHVYYYSRKQKKLM